MTQTYDIAIIGAGAVGSAIARELSRYDLKVVLVESNADVGMGTSKASTAMRDGNGHAVRVQKHGESNPFTFPQRRFHDENRSALLERLTGGVNVADRQAVLVQHSLHRVEVGIGDQAPAAFAWIAIRRADCTAARARDCAQAHQPPMIQADILVQLAFDTHRVIGQLRDASLQQLLGRQH